MENLDTVIIVCNNNIYINTKSLKKAREIELVLSASAQIYLNINNDEINELSYNEQNKINKSKLEKYRRTVV